MAHEVETMAYAGETPWHGLGVAVSNDLSAEEMMNAAGLNWEVEKLPTFFRIDDQEIMTGDSMLRRSTDGTTYGQVSNDWEVCQNSEAFAFFHDFVTAGKMTMETAGSLKGGQYVWVLAKTNESFELFKGDRIDNYMLFVNPHKYGAAIQAGMNPIRVVCNNTLRLSLSRGNNADMVALNHRNKFDPNRATELLGIAHNKFENYKNAAEFLGSKKFDRESLVQYVDEVFPVTGKKTGKNDKITVISRNAGKVLDLIESQPGAEFAEGSWWQAFNATTFLVDHIMGRDEDTRVYNAWIGTEKDRKLKSFNLALDFAKAA